jgi:hypothetical protein
MKEAAFSASFISETLVIAEQVGLGMIEELEQLGLAVGAVTLSDAKQVVEAVNRRLVSLVGAQVIKLYWREEAQEGNILQPLAHINSTRYPDPRPFQVRSDTGGVLSWVFLNASPLWLSRIKSADLNTPMCNQASQRDISAEYLDVRDSPDLDSVMAVPIMVRGQVHGIYSVEAFSSERFNPRILNLLQHIARALAPLLWNADVYAYDLEKTSRAVSRFLDSIRDFAFDPIALEQDVRSGFVARPFLPEFNRVEEVVTHLLQQRGVVARHYEPATGRGLIVDDLMKQLRNSHFSICDITAANANVIAEVGMALFAHKPMLLIRRKGDETAIPFDLGHHPVYPYETTGNRNELRIWNSAEGQFQSFDLILDTFLNGLPAETGFAAAKNFAA